MRIISGGQTGADQGGLEAGRALKIETGGWAARGWRTETGPARELLRGYGLREYVAYAYPARTKANVRDSDGTVIFGSLETPGSRVTWAECIKRQKPVCHIPYSMKNIVTTLASFRDWLTRNTITTLNVAGNRESRMPGLQAFVREFLVTALTPSAGGD